MVPRYDGLVAKVLGRKRAKQEGILEAPRPPMWWKPW